MLLIHRAHLSSTLHTYHNSLQVTDEYVHSFFERPAGIPDLNLPTHGSAKL